MISSSGLARLTSRQEELQITAKYWAHAAKIQIKDPTFNIVPLGKPCNDVDSVITPPIQMPLRAPIQDPSSDKVVEKHAHRMLRIRKRKMKIHRRKRRWKKNW